MAMTNDREKESKNLSRENKYNERKKKSLKALYITKYNTQ